MIPKTALLICLISCYVLTSVIAAPGGYGHGEHKKVIIHVPIHEKEIKHTHTKYVTIYHEGKEDHHDHYHHDPYGGDHQHHH